MPLLPWLVVPALGAAILAHERESRRTTTATTELWSVTATALEEHAQSLLLEGGAGAERRAELGPA
jgi:hypothetical protein